jgi:hypothetical protein
VYHAPTYSRPPLPRQARKRPRHLPRSWGRQDRPRLHGRRIAPRRPRGRHRRGRPPSMTASRRLQLAAEGAGSGSLCGAGGDRQRRRISANRPCDDALARLRNALNAATRSRRGSRPLAG